MEQLTDRQREVLNAYMDTGSKRAVARRLGIQPKDVRDSIKTIERKGLAPWYSGAPIAPHLKQTKTTVQLDGDGNVIQEWKRLSPVEELASEVVAGLCESVKGKGKVTKRRDRKTDKSKICYELCLYDLHFGMYACADETGGEDYDTEIASKRLHGASSDLLGRVERPDTIRIILGGDQLHADNSKNQTPKSGHALDVDTRISLVARKIITACREVVQMASEVARHVEIYVIKGNHDPESSVWLQEVLRAYYCDCSNVTVCEQHTPRKCAIWGKCMSVFAHGDQVRPDKWAQIIAAEFAKVWGQTSYRYARLGHFHHRKTIAPVALDEVSGLEVTYLSSLAAPDAWHSEGGWVGTNRGMQAFELHKDAGQISQFIHNTGE